ncbi:zf-HC2 domain-containing protein [Mucilaginibacter myungsuensis]|uniref:HEAT repeat domain-containing protein n=1 Tax=Mucilaginibacter myungsuensis TaxID=649104 RepID=A0A929KZX0_9SPHI|nr:HEAT repeat domain-containing protein [Mucilaginibacter myungsuensis]MBE9664272.1 HEAT repeat domain-containing protein [Mucilaginibacter myungsuensis]MDN3599976.1 HEAT repeat domain-containing protein [Mucilaginibacter myungsuensis]
MDCEKYEELFTGWINKDISPAEREKLEKHLATCNGCREELAFMQAMWTDMGEIATPEPSAHMEVKFRAMLDTFKTQEAEKFSFKNWLGNLWQMQPRWPMAYNLAVILVAFGFGFWAMNKGTNNQDKGQLQELSAQVHELKQTMVLAMLENPSASERMKAVSYTSEMKHADDQVIEALLSTLNNDPNVNVRLTTLETLSEMTRYPEVREGLIRSIKGQDSPLMQSAIADVMLKLQEKKSVGSFKELLKQKDLDNGVRNKIEQTISHLI